MRNVFTFILKHIYCSINNESVRRVCIKLLAKVDKGGYYYSNVIRELLEKYCNIQIDIGTYGSCFDTKNVSSGVRIGKYCSIAPNVSIYTRDHPYSYISTHPMFYNSTLGLVQKDKVEFTNLEIGNDVWIGRNSVILPSCNKIGDGAVIGAGAIVTHDIPAYAIAVGVPAKVIKYRFPENIIDSLESIKWWNWERADILKYSSLFSNPDSFIKNFSDYS